MKTESSSQLRARKNLPGQNGGGNHSSRLPALVSMALAVLGVSWIVCGCASRKPAEPLRLKVMTYNLRIGAGGGPWPDSPSKINLEPVARLIAGQAPDIVGVQEVDQFRPRSAGMDQPGWLKQRLGLDVAYAPAYTVPTGAGPDEKYGVAMLSRWPILPLVATPLYKPDYRQSHPEYPGYYSEQRVLLYAPVSVAGRQVHVFVTHLGLTSDQREKQLHQIADVIAKYQGPKILFGDFNASPTEPGIALLGRLLQDTLTAVKTAPEDRLSFPAGTQPKEAIDYIFVSSEFRVLGARVIRDATLASDHNPVIAELELAPASAR